MPHGIVHPFTRALYERWGDGDIRVTDGDRWGVFTRRGKWLDGELRECDPQLCGWVAGPQLANYRMIEAEGEATASS
jgi:hypothetical protein